MDKRREALATYAHEAWSSYMEYFLNKLGKDSKGNLIISRSYVLSLRALIATEYSELSEDDKKGDRDEADKISEVLSIHG